MPSFANTLERSRCCRLLLELAAPDHVDELWADNKDELNTGPTRRAVNFVSQHAVANHVPLSRGEVTALLVAMDFWNATGHVRIYDVLDVLANEVREAIGELVVAQVRRNIPAWLTHWQEVVDSKKET